MAEKRKSPAPAAASPSPSAAPVSQTFTAVVEEVEQGTRRIPCIRLPFRPDEVWGVRPRHLIDGTVAGIRFRAAIESIGGCPALFPGPAWMRDNPVVVGDTVEVSIVPDGPQRNALDPDFAAALDAEPEAAAFWDGLAQFYRKAYLTWISSTKKSPDERVRRIAETVRFLKAGVKQRH